MSREIDTSTALAGSRTDHEARKLVSCPYKVLIDGKTVDEFYDIRDAVAVARMAKSKSPVSQVTVADQPLGRLIVEI